MGKASLEFLSKTDVAELLGVSKKTIYNYTTSGILKGYKMGSRKVLYKKNEVEAALTEISPK
ncbi:helix-turn-helix domain-containing protein [Zunongwangia sp. F260]|uniref:Helix-turn-helix domain-containing protein n=1 Tax=Autumnicola lenta TaxID=3075593 RepID=A0ABU3CMC8_9FLAO|nr:helix-turn-helix domain-containing protein [Zunongwangia sp. F260]MDT0647471.1 helix-turn-helix domain-containing protein [Zunongwangia sp. F260]